MEIHTPKIAGGLQQKQQRLTRNETDATPMALGGKFGQSRNLSVIHTDADALLPPKPGKFSKARGSLGLATGATSGEMLSASGPSQKRKASVAPPQASELFRDPSVQMDSHNNYIDSRMVLNKHGGAPGAFNTAQSDNTAHVKKIHRSEFLPTISNSRRLMQLETDDTVLSALNPFKVAAGTERVLALGERSREADKLARLKFQLVQKEAEGPEYVANMSKKQLNLK